MSFAVYYSRLEGLARNKLAGGAVARISTVEIAYALGVTIEEAVAIFANYSRIPNRQFEFQTLNRGFLNLGQRELLVRAVVQDSRQAG